jgi:hypothetical protein
LSKAGGHKPNILQDLVKHSVRVGDLWIPSRLVQSTLGEYCLNLFVWTHDETHKVQLLGTAIPIKYRERYLLLCSAHQIKGVEPRDVCLVYPDGSRAVTNSGIRAFDASQRAETDAYDIAAFEFTDPISQHPNLGKKFYPFRELPPDVSSDQIIAFVVVGFPSKDQVYELEERSHLGTVKRNLTARPSGQPGDQSLIRASYLEPLDFDPDGLSGSPVFVVQFDGSNPKAYLGGMVLRSGEKDFRFLKIGYVKDFLDRFMQE